MDLDLVKYVLSFIAGGIAGYIFVHFLIFWIVTRGGGRW